MKNEAVNEFSDNLLRHLTVTNQMSSQKSSEVKGFIEKCGIIELKLEVRSLKFLKSPQKIGHMTEKNSLFFK